MLQGTQSEAGEMLLQAQGLHAQRGGVPILRDVHLAIGAGSSSSLMPGRIIGLLGPSGIGKTTLVRILAGLDYPDAGSVVLGAARIPVQAGQVGLVAQHSPLFEHRRVLSNLLVAGRGAGLSPQHARVKAEGLLSHFGLLAHSHHYPAQLSGGQRKRVAIAQQFMGGGLVFLDEPFSGLDILAVEAVCQLIRQAACSGEAQAIVLVTHDIGACLFIADTIWLLGRDHDAQGVPVAGARLQGVYTVADPKQTPQELEQTIRQAYPRL